jgi:hypothetical protein
MRAVLWMLGVGLGLSAAGLSTARAHEGDVDGVDLLDALEHVETLLPTATGKALRSYKRIAAQLGKSDQPGVKDDLAHLKRARKFSRKIVPADIDLDDLLVEAAEQADAVLAIGTPDSLADLVQQISRSADRTKVERVAAKAAELRAVGRSALDLSDVDLAVAKLLASAKRYAGAMKLARKLIQKQGGGLPQFKTAEARTVYTVIGSGAGGHNGDGRAARRSSLYFVIDTTIGPDGARSG